MKAVENPTTVHRVPNNCEDESIWGEPAKIGQNASRFEAHEFSDNNKESYNLYLSVCVCVCVCVLVVILYILHFEGGKVGRS